MTAPNSSPSALTPGSGGRCGPNFFVIGAQKAGTTRLCNLLQRHPSVAIPIKEPLHFQSARAVAERAEWYQGVFQAVADIPARGDGSTYYSMCEMYPGTASRIYNFNPESRIIYMVRHPLRRIESSWRQWLSTGDASPLLGFEYTLYRTHMLLDPSMYWKQLNEYRRYFPDSQIRIGFFEDFVADESAELQACLSFLGVDPSVRIDMDDGDGRNPSEGKRRPLGIVHAVRAIPRRDIVTRFIPDSVKDLFRERITRPTPLGSNWTSDSLRWAVSRLADDTAALLRHTGRDEDYWPML